MYELNDEMLASDNEALLETGDFEGAFEADFEGDYESDFEGDFEGETSLTPDQEMELAAELLAVGNDQELDEFFRNLFQKVRKAAGNFIRSPTGRAVGGLLRNVAKKALPILGRAAGAAVGGPVGGWLAGKAASAIGNRLFGLELEGMSPEDQEFEVARRVVRLAADTAQRAARAPRSAAPQQAARKALAAAARRHAPGLLAGATPATRSVGRRATSGRWVRQGNRIVILNAF